MNNYVAKIKLSNFLGSKVVDLENDETGELEKGIFIPIELNSLFLTPRNQVIAWAFVNEKLHDTGDGFSHYLKLKTDKYHIKKLNDLGYETPYLGSMKTSTFFTKSQELIESGIIGRVKNINL